MKAMGTMVRKKSVAQSAKDPSKVDVQAAAIARPISEDSSATEKCDVLLMYGRKFDVSARRPFPWPLRNERLRFYICRDCKTPSRTRRRPVPRQRDGVLPQPP